MDHRLYNVLFLCTGNSARSILAESILRKDGQGRFQAFSAGSQPKGQINPFAIKVLERLDYPTDGMRSKSWMEFAAPDAPVMDFVFTVCDSAAGESCPVWPGHPILINRPIVVTPKGVKLCRPSEAVLDILPNANIGRFVKEDGEVVEAAAVKA